MIKAAASMAPYFLVKVLMLFLLCTLVRCVRFYMLENTELVNETRMKRVVLNSQPTECLGECIHFYDCKSFNVFYDEFGRLTCDLYEKLDGTLKYSLLAMHFTLNAHASKSPTTTQNEITTSRVNPTTQEAFSATSPTVTQTTKMLSTAQEVSTQLPTTVALESTSHSTTVLSTTLKETTDVVGESINVIKQVDNKPYCVSTALKWISKDGENTACQQFYFVNGGALKLPNGHCAEISGSVIKFASSSSCDSFTYDNTTKQFQYTKDVNYCIMFMNSKDPMNDHCHDTRQYNKHVI